MSAEADRIRSVINALVQVRQHVAVGSYGEKYPTSIFNRWIDTLIGEPLENARPLRLRWFFIDRDRLVLHLDGAIAFLAEELAAYDGGSELTGEGNAGKRGVGWTPRIVKD